MHECNLSRERTIHCVCELRACMCAACMYVSCVCTDGAGVAERVRGVRRVRRVVAVARQVGACAVRRRVQQRAARHCRVQLSRRRAHAHTASRATRKQEIYVLRKYVYKILLASLYVTKVYGPRC